MGTFYPIIHPLNHDGLFSICRHLRQRQLKHLIISLLHIDNRALEKKNPLAVTTELSKPSLSCGDEPETFGSFTWESTWTRKQACHWSAKIRQLADYGVPLPCVRIGVRSSESTRGETWSMVLEVFLDPSICAVPMGPVHLLYSLSHSKKFPERHYKNKFTYCSVLREILNKFATSCKR